jgi:hypothetical protein
MLVLVLGLPGWFSERCENLVLHLLRRAYGAAELIRADTLEDVALSLLRIRTTHNVLGAREPCGDIKCALVEAGARFIVALDDPRVALSHLVNHDHMGFIAATRLVASGCASVIGFRESPGALVLHADPDGADPLSLAATIAEHLRLTVGEDELVGLVREAGEDGSAPTTDFASGWWSDLDRAQRETARGAVDAFLYYFAGRSWYPINWAPELFVAGDRGTEPATDSIDITGRPRCLLTGPHILLPPGAWSFSISLDFSADTVEHNFVLELTDGTQLKRSLIRRERAGVFDARVTLALDELPNKPIDLRLLNERPAFDGYVRLLGVSVIRQSDDGESSSSPLNAR